jgi:phospho-N-acetylmuramoyl-pentapeptide-transferase
MILFLLQFLHGWGIHIPSGLTNFSTRMILSAATALLFVIALGPRFIKKLYALKIGQPIRSVEEVPLLAELHEKKKDTPTMGGVLILASLGLSLFLWMDLQNVYTLILLVTMLVLGLLGGLDDYKKLKLKNSKGIRGKKKLYVQVGLSSLVALYLLSPTVQNAISTGNWFRPPASKEQSLIPREGKRPRIFAKTISLTEAAKQFYLPFLKAPLVLPSVLTFLLILFVVTGSSNAVNLTDGLDGLAAGCLVMVSLVLGLFAFLSNHIELARYLNILYIEGSGEIGVFLFAIAGSCLGFLWYNGYPAQVFMGDTGSLALGGLLGVSAILLRREMVLAIAGGIFVAEAMSVILQVLSYRYRNKKRIFLCAPLHHHFEYKGWPEMKVVVRFWNISLLFAIIAVASLKFQ